MTSFGETTVTVPKQPEAVTRHWGRQLTRREIAEGVRRTLPPRVKLVASPAAAV